MAQRVFLFKAPFAQRTGVADIRVEADSDEDAAAQVDAFFADWEDVTDWRSEVSYVTTPTGDLDPLAEPDTGAYLRSDENA